MRPSRYNGRHLTYVDPAKLVHTGIVIGESEDGDWIYVQSDQFAAGPDDWHFKVARVMLPGMLDD